MKAPLSTVEGDDAPDGVAVAEHRPQLAAPAAHAEHSPRGESSNQIRSGFLERPEREGPI